MGGRGADSDLKKQTVNQLKKGIKSTKKSISVHYDKIKRPHHYVKDFDQKDERYKNGLIKKWKNDIEKLEMDIIKKEEEIKRRL